MTPREKQLYHQIHPLKLGADISASIVSTYFFWVHNVWWGIITFWAPPIIVSALMLNLMDFSRIKASAAGRYVQRTMTPAMQALRLAGTIPMVFGAWFHQPLAIGFGVLMVLFGWFRGLMFPPRRSTDALSPL